MRRGPATALAILATLATLAALLLAAAPAAPRSVPLPGAAARAPTTPAAPARCLPDLTTAPSLTAAGHLDPAALSASTSSSYALARRADLLGGIPQRLGNGDGPQKLRCF